jgi:hypothetical protein
VGRVLAVVLALVVTCDLAYAAFPFDETIPRPLQLRVLGRFAPDRKSTNPGSGYVMSMGFGERVRWLVIDEIRTVGGDHTLLGADVLALLATRQPNLLVVGPADLRQMLEQVPDWTTVRFEGTVERGSQTYLLRTVTVNPTTPP